jgi:hypothetical protein
MAEKIMSRQRKTQPIPKMDLRHQEVSCLWESKMPGLKMTEIAKSWEYEDLP